MALHIVAKIGSLFNSPLLEMPSKKSSGPTILLQTFSYLGSTINTSGFKGRTQRGKHGLMTQRVSWSSTFDSYGYSATLDSKVVKVYSTMVSV